MKDSIWYLENIDLFSIFCPKKSKDMNDKFPMTTFNKNEFIYMPNEKSTHVYMIAEGRVKIGTYSDDGREVIKTVLQKGEVFGEMAILGEDVRKNYAQSVDQEVKICPLSLEEMENLMHNDKELSIKMTRLIGLRLAKMEKKVESLVFKDSKTRIVEYLVELGEEKGVKVGFETLVKQFFTHQDIAKITATARQTVTTVLNDLRDQNLITFDRRRLLIRDIDKLRKKVGN
ncbi:MAG: Crp/Fnr family transcriptional regulator [Cyclobacteriaceae bacterium]